MHYFMYQKFTKTKAIANKGNAMEAETIKKNAVSLKNQRSRDNKIAIGG